MWRVALTIARFTSYATTEQLCCKWYVGRSKVPVYASWHTVKEVILFHCMRYVIQLQMSE